MKFLFVLLFLPITLIAQINPKFKVTSKIFYEKIEYSGSGLFGFIQDGNVGYIDKNKNVIIPSTLGLKPGAYNSIPKFNEDYAVFKKDSKYGVVYRTGKEIIPFEYKSLNVYTDPALFVVASKEVNNKDLYGVMNMQKKIIIPFEYDYITFYGSYIVVKKNYRYGIKSITGKDVLPVEYDQLIVYPEDKVAKAQKGDDYGFIDLNGKWLFKKSKAVYDLYSFSHGMILCKVNNKYGYLNLSGEEVISTQYDKANSFNEYGLAKVGTFIGNSSYNTQFGYINKQGKVIIPIQYKTLADFRNGAAFVQDPVTNRYGYLDTKGNWLLKPIYIYTNYSFDDYGGAWVKMPDNKYHYVDKRGKDYGILVKDGSSFINFYTDYAVIKETETPFSMLDAKGNELKVFDDYKNIFSFADGIAGYQSKENNLYGFINIKGKKITEAEFTGFNAFNNGIARVSKNINGKSKSGYIDTTGKEIIPFKYDNASIFDDGWAIVTKDSIFYFIDKNGKEKPTVRKYDKLTSFRSGFALGTVEDTGKYKTYYYIDKNLKESITIKALQAYGFQENIAVINRSGVYELMDTNGKVYKEMTGIESIKFSKEGLMAVKKDKKWGYMDAVGNLLIPYTYEDCDHFEGEYARVKLNDKWGIIDKKGKMVIEPQYENIEPGNRGNFIYYKDKYFGIIDKNGNLVTQPIYNTITPLYNGIAISKLKSSYVIIQSPLKK